MVPIQASVFTIPKSKVMIYTGAKLGSSNIRNIYLKNVSYEHFPSDEIDYEKYEDYLKVFIYRNPLERFLSGQVQDLRGYFEGYIWHDEIIERRPDLVDRLYQVYTEKKDKVIGHHHSVIDLHNRIHVLGGFKDLNNPDAKIVVTMHNDIVLNENWATNLIKMHQKCQKLSRKHPHRWQ